MPKSAGTGVGGKDTWASAFCGARGAAVRGFEVIRTTVGSSAGLTAIAATGPASRRQMSRNRDRVLMAGSGKHDTINVMIGVHCFLAVPDDGTSSGPAGTVRSFSGPEIPHNTFNAPLPMSDNTGAIMKPFHCLPSHGTAIVMLLAAAVLFAGCASDTPASPGGPAAPGTTPLPGTVPGSASLPYGVSLTVPADWTREDVLTSDVRDYGTRTVRIAQFTSPVTIPGDAASQNTLSVDLDQNPGGDFEVYFNQATLALQKSYSTQLDSHSIVRSSTLQISGFKSYEVDFQTAEVKGSYIFTSTDKGMYIFAFKGPAKPVPIQALQAQIVGIHKSIRITP